MQIVILLIHVTQTLLISLGHTIMTWPMPCRPWSKIWCTKKYYKTLVFKNCKIKNFALKIIYGKIIEFILTKLKFLLFFSGIQNDQKQYFMPGRKISWNGLYHGFINKMVFHWGLRAVITCFSCSAFFVCFWSLQGICYHTCRKPGFGDSNEFIVPVRGLYLETI